MRNLITDVPGVRVGNAHDPRAAAGVTAALFDRGCVASVATLGGGSCAVSLLEPEMTRGVIDAVVFSGGSLYGLDAAGGVTAVLCAQGKGAQFGGITLPVAVQAILFDLMNGGENDWLKPMTHRPPYWELGREAALAAAADFALGTAGAGYGATTVTLKGGLGSTSARTSQGFAVGALVAVNAVGSATLGDGPHFWAASYDGLSKALRPVHAPNEGDTVFAVATAGAGPAGDPPLLTELGTVAADCLARAVARGVYEATALPYETSLPDWKRFATGTALA